MVMKVPPIEATVDELATAIAMRKRFEKQLGELPPNLAEWVVGCVYHRFVDNKNKPTETASAAKGTD